MDLQNKTNKNDRFQGKLYAEARILPNFFIFVCLFTCPAVYVRFSIYYYLITTSLCLSVCLSVSVCLSLSVSLFLSLFLSICLSLFLSFNPCSAFVYFTLYVSLHPNLFIMYTEFSYLIFFSSILSLTLPHSFHVSEHQIFDLIFSVIMFLATIVNVNSFKREQRGKETSF